MLLCMIFNIYLLYVLIDSFIVTLIITRSFFLFYYVLHFLHVLFSQHELLQEYIKFRLQKIHIIIES